MRRDEEHLRMKVPRTDTHGKGREDVRKQDGKTRHEKNGERVRKWTERHGVGRSSVIPATRDDRKSECKRSKLRLTRM